MAIIIYIDLLHGIRRTSTYWMAGPNTRMAPTSLSRMDEYEEIKAYMIQISISSYAPRSRRIILPPPPSSAINPSSEPLVYTQGVNYLEYQEAQPSQECEGWLEERPSAQEQRLLRW